MQILIAGSTGFIGSELVRQGLEAGHQVFPMVRGGSKASFDPEAIQEGRLVPVPFGASAEVLAAGFGLEPGSRILNAAGLPRERKDADLEAAHKGVAAELSQLAEALEADRFVHLSALGGESEDPWGASKRAAEASIRACSRPWAILRSAPVYGPGDALLDEIGAWLMRSPIIPSFLEETPIQPVYVGDLAQAMLASETGEHELGGEALTWGELLRKCAQAAGKELWAWRMADQRVRALARFFGDRGWMDPLIPFCEAGFLRHQKGYMARNNALPRLLGRPPRALEAYLETEWPYRAG